MTSLLFGPLGFGFADWLALFGHFTLLSLLAIGGAITTAPDMQRFVVGERGWLGEAQFASSVALAQAAPGPNVLFVAVIGFNVGGLAGVIATMVGTLLPSTVLTLKATRFGAARRESRALRAFTAGLAPLTLGLLLATGWILYEPAATAPGAALLAVITLVVMLRTKWSPLWPIGLGAIVGGLGWLMIRTVLVLLLIAGALYAAVLALLWFGQERLLFAPSRLPADHRFMFGTDVQETWVEVEGGRLNALHLKTKDPQGIVFFLHGNGGDLQSWFTNTDFYRKARTDLFMIDYRGYGKSGGRIESEKQLLDDVRAAWKQVAPMYAGKRRVIYGRSLGSGLAATIAAELQPEMTILVSPYTSMIDLARQYYPWVPPLVLRYPLRTDEALRRILSPVMLVHGDGDTLIGPEHSRQLKAISPQAELLLVPGAGHNDLQDFPVYLDGVSRAMAPAR